jgi:Kae1-associated kinase Bud32
MKLIAQGAEAKIFQDNQTIIKERFEKKYRIQSLDKSLRQFRTRREAKVLGKLEKAKFQSPKLISVDDKKMLINMQLIQGEKLKDIIHTTPIKYANRMGKIIANLHNLDIIHSDLTTSNILVNEKDKLFLIDFGLSYFSSKIEDKAVDLFLLERSLLSSHYKLPKLFTQVLKSYHKHSSEATKIQERLVAVRKRGRNKKK